MLSSSLRRAVLSPIVPLSSISRISSQALVTSSTGLLSATRPVHQRRYSSSSKPPVPPSDGSSRIDTSSQTHTKSVSASGEKREGKGTRRRGRDHSRHGSLKSSQQHAAFSNPPSVPSTQHLQPNAADVHVASFFSIHRPISVTSTVPPTSSAEAFNAIFDLKRSSKNEPEDVIYTLSSAVDSMEHAAHQDGLQNILNGGGSVTHVDAESNQHDDMIVSEWNISIEEFAKRHLPFHPPPPPVPFDESKDVSATEHRDQASKHTSSYSTVLTIRESTHADGRKTYEAHTTPLVRTEDMEAPAGLHTDSLIDMPENSGMTYVERSQQNRTMHAISTKRRRRLKMKKHKYKKLLRRTRTLRRKLEKA